MQVSRVWVISELCLLNSHPGLLSCTASSEWGDTDSYVCENALNLASPAHWSSYWEGIGAWLTIITLTKGRSRSIAKVRLKNRPFGEKEKFSGYPFLSGKLYSASSLSPASSRSAVRRGMYITAILKMYSGSLCHCAMGASLHKFAFSIHEAKVQDQTLLPFLPSCPSLGWCIT